MNIDFGSELTKYCIVLEIYIFLPKLLVDIEMGPITVLYWYYTLHVDNIIIYVLNQIVLYIYQYIFLKDKYRPILSFLTYRYCDHLPRRSLRVMILCNIYILTEIRQQWSERIVDLNLTE